MNNKQEQPPQEHFEEDGLTEPEMPEQEMPELKRPELEITEEEKQLAERAHELGGESNLSREEHERILELRFGRGGQREYPLSAKEAGELARLQVKDYFGVRGQGKKLSTTERRRIRELSQKRKKF